MAKRFSRSSTNSEELVAEYLDQREEDLMQALVAAGAFVALADGQVQLVERDELVRFLAARRVLKHTPKGDMSDGFDSRVRQFRRGNRIEAIVKALRPVSRLSMSTIVMRAAERVAAADRCMHDDEVLAIKFMRQIMMDSLTNDRSVALGR
jgi:tellurite resistance protein